MKWSLEPPFRWSWYKNYTGMS